MLQKETKYLCACVYNIYIYIYTHTIYVFLLNVFLWDFNQNRDKQAFHINAFNSLTNFWIQISFYLQFNWENVCGACECVCVCVHTCVAHASCSQRHTCDREHNSFTKIVLIQISFGWFSIRSLARGIDGSSSASLISSWIFFFSSSSNNCLKLLEYCP